MATRTVRAHDETIEKLRRIAALTGASMPDLLRESVDMLERERFLDAANAAFARARSDEAAWADERAERAAWSGTLADGLGGS